MFCPKCGAKNREDAGQCVICKAALPSTAAPAGAPAASSAQAAAQPSAPVLAADPNAHVPNHLVPALITTLFCCIPAGIVAIIYSLQVESKVQAGDRDGALRASNNAKTWCWVAFGGGALLMVFWILIAIIGVAAEAA